MWLLWLIAALVFILSDLHLQAFYAVFLGFGAVAAAIGAAAGVDLWVQGVLFAGVAAIGIVSLRPPLSRWLQSKAQPVSVVPGTHGGFVGQQSVALEKIGDENAPGHIKLGNERWLAVTDAASPIAKDTKVEVVAIRGTTMLVRAVTTQEAKPNG